MGSTKQKLLGNMFVDEGHSLPIMLKKIDILENEYFYLWKFPLQNGNVWSDFTKIVEDQRVPANVS